MITFRHETLRAILEATEDEALIRKGREIGTKIPREFHCFAVCDAAILTGSQTGEAGGT